MIIKCLSMMELNFDSITSMVPVISNQPGPHPGLFEYGCGRYCTFSSMNFHLLAIVRANGCIS